jgi:hypothetical protein
MKQIAKKFLYVGLTAALISCNNSNNTENEGFSDVDTSSAAKLEKNIKAKKVFSTIPAPVESISLLKAAGAKYNPDYLNSIDNVSKYSSVKAKALNLGIYGSDLSFISLFDQSQESILYLRCTNTLARGLGISGVFDENTSSRIESNMENKDSLLDIISQSFWAADNYLIDNDQPGVSALIVAGGWIEGLYISTRVAENTKNDGVAKQIGDQKRSLTNLLDLLDSYKRDNQGVSEVLASLDALKSIFDTASPAKDKPESIEVTPEVMKKITKTVADIRSSFITNN